MDIYTDPSLLDVIGALEALPTLSLVSLLTVHDGPPGSLGMRAE